MSTSSTTRLNVFPSVPRLFFYLLRVELALIALGVPFGMLLAVSLNAYVCLYQARVAIVTLIIVKSSKKKKKKVLENEGG